MRLAAVRNAILSIVVPVALALCACLVLGAGTAHAGRFTGPADVRVTPASTSSPGSGCAPSSGPSENPQTPQPQNDPWD